MGGPELGGEARLQTGVCLFPPHPALPQAAHAQALQGVP